MSIIQWKLVEKLPLPQNETLADPTLTKAPPSSIESVVQSDTPTPPPSQPLNETAEEESRISSSPTLLENSLEQTVEPSEDHSEEQSEGGSEELAGQRPGGTLVLGSLAPLRRPLGRCHGLPEAHGMPIVRCMHLPGDSVHSFPISRRVFSPVKLKGTGMVRSQFGGEHLSVGWQVSWSEGVVEGQPPGSRRR